MKNFLKMSLLLVLALAITYPLMARDKSEKKGKGKNPAAGPIDALMKKVADAGLSDDQTKKLKDAAEAAKEKLKEVASKVAPEVHKQLAEARKKASGEGKKGKDLKAAVDAAVKLTDEQKSALADIEKVIGEFRKTVTETLTAEQREKVGLKGKKK